MKFVFKLIVFIVMMTLYIPNILISCLISLYNWDRSFEKFAEGCTDNILELLKL